MPIHMTDHFTQMCAAAPVSDPSTQRSAPIRVLLSTHDPDDGKPHKYKR